MCLYCACWDQTSDGGVAFVQVDIPVVCSCKVQVDQGCGISTA